MAQKKAERFWEYALVVYGQESVREALLRLQDRDGADVPVLLWCLWCDAEQQNISESAMTQAVEFSTVWRNQTVNPLRTLRKALKTGIPNISRGLSDAARAKIATTEQAVERLQMDHLAMLKTDNGSGGSSGNVDRYARIAGLSLDASDVSALQQAR